MTKQQKIDCCQRGSANRPDVADVPLHGWLWGQLGKESTLEEQIAFVEKTFRKNAESTTKTLHAILEIPYGKVITYAELALKTNKMYGTNVGALNVAKVREMIYFAVGHDTEIPLHRIKSLGDEDSVNDDRVTREFNRILRAEERAQR